MLGLRPTSFKLVISKMGSGLVDRRWSPFRPVGEHAFVRAEIGQICVLFSIKAVNLLIKYFQSSD